MSATAARDLSTLERRQSLTALIVSSFGVGVAFGMGYPLAALTLEAWGETSFIIGLAGAAPSVAILVALPLLPRLLPGINPVAIMVSGSVITAITYALMYLLPNAWAWIVIRFVMGAGLALPWLVGETWINLVADETNRARVIAFYAVSFFAGFAAGPLVLEVTGIAGPLPFAVGALGAIFATLPILAARDLAPAIENEDASGLWRSVLMAPAAMLGAFLGGFLETSHFSLLANVGTAAGLDESRALNLLTLLLAGGLAMQYTLGWLGDTMSRHVVLLGIGILYVVLALALPMTLGTGWPAAAIVFVTGGLVIGFYTLGLAIVGEDVPPARLAAANAAFIMSYTAGSVVGPAAAGAMMLQAPVLGFVAANAAAAVVLTVLTALARRKA